MAKFDCHCWMSYPNENHRYYGLSDTPKKSGKWKCVDSYQYVGKSIYGATHCKRKEMVTIECPNCGGKSNVINSRAVEMNVFRMRVCKNCGFRFYTEELTIDKDEANAYMAAIKRSDRLRHQERKYKNGKEQKSGDTQRTKRA